MCSHNKRYTYIFPEDNYTLMSCATHWLVLVTLYLTWPFYNTCVNLRIASMWESVDKSQSELVYTVLYDQNLLLDLDRNQICVIWTQHWSFAAVNVGKKSPFLPTHWRNGGSCAGNKYIFKGGPKHRDEFRCSERVSSSCSTSDTHRVTLVTNPKYHMKPEISSEWGKDREFEVFMTSWTYPWSFVTQLMVFRDS